MSSIINIPKALKKKKGFFSPVWITPIVAFIVTVWLIYNGYVNTGTQIAIQFDSGSELVPEKTTVKYKGIIVGKVKNVRIAEDPDKVVANVLLTNDANILAKEGMMFWIVKPRVGFNKITGLDTLISGAYIEVLPPTFDMAKLKALPDQTHFIGLNDPPDMEAVTENSLPVHLRAKQNEYLVKGVPVFFKNMLAGEVSSVKFDNETLTYDIIAYITKEYKDFITEDTFFWDIGGLEIKYDAAGLLIETPPLSSLISGGIAFDNPPNAKKLAAGNQPVFELYSSELKSKLSDQTISIHMKNSGGIQAGRTPVMYMGMPAGIVTGLMPTEDLKSVVAEIRLNKEFVPLAKTNTRFVLIHPEFSLSGVSGIGTLLTGVYIEMFPADGQFSTTFNIYENVPAKGELAGQKLRIKADHKGSLNIMSGIFFKNIQIGHVTDIVLQKDHSLDIDIIIYEDYKYLLNEGIYLRRTQGFDASFGSAGLKVTTESLNAILNGGISVEYFGKSGKIPKILFESEASAKKVFLKDIGVKILTLETDTAEDISSGDGIFYKGFKIGEVGSLNLSKENSSISAELLIYPEFAHLTNPSSVFYKAGGISVEANANGIQMNTPSLASVIQGGIYMLNPDKPFAATVHNTVSKLYMNKSEAERALILSGRGIKVTLTAEGAVLPKVGAGVYYHNMTAGSVAAVRMNNNGIPEVEIAIAPEFNRYVDNNTRFWLEGGLEVTADTAGVTVKSKPMMTYVEYAVFFDTFSTSYGKNRLFLNAKKAKEADMSEVYVTFPYLIGIKPGAPLIFGKAEAGYAAESIVSGGTTKVHILVYNNFADQLRQGASFWTEGVKFSGGSIENVDAMLFGTTIYMLGGNGELQKNFTALKESPSPYAGMKGLRIKLISPLRHSIEKGSPVYYRQIETGGVEDVRLAADGRNVVISVFIKDEFARLVKDNSVFWNAGGIGAKVSLFGVKVKTESVKTILLGGIGFATPDSAGNQAKDNDTFSLYQDPKSSWLEWQPNLTETNTNSNN